MTLEKAKVDCNRTNKSSYLKGWVIATSDANGIITTVDSSIYNSELTVNEDIEQFAFENPGTSYIKLEIQSYVKSNGVVWY